MKYWKNICALGLAALITFTGLVPVAAEEITEVYSSEMAGTEEEGMNVSGSEIAGTEEEGTGADVFGICSSEEASLSRVVYTDTISEEEFMGSSEAYSVSLFSAYNGIETSARYGDQLTGDTRTIYDWCLSSMTAAENTVTLTHTLEEGETYDEYWTYFKSIYKKALFAFKYDYPDRVLWSDSIVSAQAIDTGDKTSSITCTATVNASPYFTSEEASAVINTIADLVTEAPSAEYDKILYFAEYLRTHCTYQSEANTAQTDSEIFWYAHSPQGCMVKGTGVCESYAKSLKMMCDQSGIPCILVTSSSHMWNYVRMEDGKWYLVDPTNADGDQALVMKYVLTANNPAMDSLHTEDDTFTRPEVSSTDYQKAESDSSESSQTTESQTTESESTSTETKPAESETTSTETKTTESETAVVSDGEIYVTQSAINVRSGAGTSYTKLGTLDSGVEVNVLEISSNYWGRIDYKGQTGWISLSYCTEKSSAADIYQVTASSLSVRSGAGTSYTRIGSLASGTKVTVLEISSNYWGRIDYKGQTGWISLSYCSKVKNEETSTADSTESTQTTEKDQASESQTTESQTSESQTSESSQTTESKTTETQTANPIYQVTASGLNVRSGAGTSYSKLGTLAQGTKVEVLEIQNNWGRFDYNGKNGWICLDYCSKVSSQTTGTSTGTTTGTTTGGTSSSQTVSAVSYKVTASSLNVRSGAGTSYSKLGSLSKGTVVSVTATKNGWGKITYKGKTGWILLSYCKKV